MKELIFATNNQHKVEEIKHALGDQVSVMTLGEAGIAIDIPEPFETLEENAREKCRVIHQLTGKNCFSEDTGLEVDGLQGAPGVRSARYAGEPSNASANIDLLLNNLQGMDNRAARFRTVICLVLEEKEYLFEGICEGTILPHRSGSQGFGYDPVFVPEGADKSFAQMDLAEKNRYSHRRKAADKLVLFLQQQLTS